MNFLANFLVICVESWWFSRYCKPVSIIWPFFCNWLTSFCFKERRNSWCRKSKTIYTSVPMKKSDPKISKFWDRIYRSRSRLTCATARYSTCPVLQGWLRSAPSSRRSPAWAPQSALPANGFPGTACQAASTVHRWPWPSASHMHLTMPRTANWVRIHYRRLESLRVPFRRAIIDIEKEATVDGCPQLLIKKMTV